MDAKSSTLLTILERVRSYLDEPDVNSKFTNDYIVRHWIMPSFMDVMARLNLNRDEPVVNRVTISLVANQEYYQLPPCIQEVMRLFQYSDNFQVKRDAYPLHTNNPRGPIWGLEGNTLFIRPTPTLAEDWTVEYISNGDVAICYNEGTSNGATMAADGTTVTLSSTAPTLGSRDLRDTAYVGSILRIIPDGGDHEERIISSYDAGTRVCGLRRPFTHNLGSSNLRYEIVPFTASQSLLEAIATRAAMKGGAGRGISQAWRDTLTQEHKMAMKTIKDNLQYYNTRTGKSFEKDTFDNPFNMYWP